MKKILYQLMQIERAGKDTADDLRMENEVLIIQLNHIGLSAGRVLWIQLLKQKEREIQI